MQKESGFQAKLQFHSLVALQDGQRVARMVIRQISNMGCLGIIFIFNSLSALRDSFHHTGFWGFTPPAKSVRPLETCSRQILRPFGTYKQNMEICEKLVKRSSFLAVLV
jgi:hypothetical protein